MILSPKVYCKTFGDSNLFQSSRQVFKNRIIIIRRKALQKFDRDK